jgi:iron complex outermembrane receptor protein
MPIVHDLKKRLPMWQLQHQVVVTIANIFDTEYRQHLSRIKSVMPEPGRNVKLLYRLNF